jgi:hypothetical protein
MAQYFFGMSKAERQNILDQHKTIYDGYVTQYNQTSNLTPLYVQDLANDKGGITVSNKGNVTTYKNVGINEDIDRTDRIADGPYDLKNGTVDLDSVPSTMEDNTELMHDIYPSPNEDEVEFISIGLNGDEDDEDSLPIFSTHFEDDEEENPIKYEYNIEELDDFMSGQMNEVYDEVDEDIVDSFREKLNESLDMFQRFKKYN